MNLVACSVKLTHQEIPGVHLVKGTWNYILLLQLMTHYSGGNNIFGPYDKLPCVLKYYIIQNYNLSALH